MADEPKCPKCNFENTYHDGNLQVCPSCAHEWNPEDQKAEVPPESSEKVFRDAHGNILQNGDSVTVIKDLKVKGSSSVVKVGTKVKHIRLVDGPDGHDIACKIEGFGQMNLKSEYVKKA